MKISYFIILNILFIINIISILSFIINIIYIPELSSSLVKTLTEICCCLIFPATIGSIVIYPEFKNDLFLSTDKN